MIENNPYYPSIQQLISADQFPQELAFVGEAVDELLNQVFFKDYRVDKGYYQEYAFYRMTLILFKEIGFEIPATGGMTLVVNPGEFPESIEIPIELEYEWEILKYRSQFDFSSFDNSIVSIIEILLDISGSSKELLLFEVMYSFQEEIDALQDFIDRFQGEYGVALPARNEDESIIDFLLRILSDIEESASLAEVVYQLFFKDDPFQDAFDKVVEIFSRLIKNFTSNDWNRLILPRVRFEIEDISLGLQFPRKWLVPVNTATLAIPDIELDAPLPEPYRSVLKYNAGSLQFSTTDGIRFEEADSFELQKSMIGKTGLLIEFEGLKVDLQSDESIPEAIADGRDESFRGVYAESASITLPKKWFKNTNVDSMRLAGYNILIGTGGLSGAIALEPVGNSPNPMLTAKIGENGFTVGFEKFDITFKQNTVVSSIIAGELTIPRFSKQGDVNKPAKVQIKGHLDADGDFLLTASKKEGFAPIQIKDVMNLEILSLELGKEEDEFFIGTSCKVTLTNPLMHKMIGSQQIEIPSLRIYSDGSFEILSGTIPVPSNFKLDLEVVTVAITGINIGSYQKNDRKYNFIGFDGAIGLGPLGVEAKGKGMQYFYTVDEGPHDSYFVLQTIEVNIIIPGTASAETAKAIINGYLTIPQPGEELPNGKKKEDFEGEVTLKLPQQGISARASMKLNPKHPAFLVDAEVDLPTPIPLASTGLGFYGFRGLLGFRYIADKEAAGLTSGENTWYDYYQVPPKGVHPSKFRTPENTGDARNPVSLGAGTHAGHHS